MSQDSSGEIFSFIFAAIGLIWLISLVFALVGLVVTLILYAIFILGLGILLCWIANEIYKANFLQIHVKKINKILQKISKNEARQTRAIKNTEGLPIEERESALNKSKKELEDLFAEYKKIKEKIIFHLENSLKCQTDKWNEIISNASKEKSSENFKNKIAKIQEKIDTLEENIKRVNDFDITERKPLEILTEKSIKEDT